MFKHTYFADDIEMLVDKSRKEIEDKLQSLYEDARNCFNMKK